MLHGFDFLRQQYSQLAKPGAGQQTVVSTIQTLAERLTKADETQSPLEDRRAAVLALKGLSRDHTRQVGEKGLPALLISLQRDVKDEELARALIECCITLCEVTPAGSEPHRQSGARKKQQEAGPPAGLLNTDIFLSEPGPLHALLPLLAPDRAFYTRFASLQLLGFLLRNRPSRVHDHVLVAPGGCGAILECLAEGAGSSAEIVRNEVLLLLPHLVHGNADIQKLVAFEGAFEKLLDVCAVEGRIEGGVIVQDALEGLESLLRYNVSNQNYFRETLSIPMLAPLLFYPPPPPSGQGGAFAEQEHARQLEAFSFQEWDQQKLLNARLVVGIIGMLVGGQGEGRKANQAALLQCGVTKCLAELALASTAPASLKAQSLHVLASLLRASRANQEQLSTLHIFPIQMVLGEGAAAGDPHLDPAFGGGASASLRLSGEYAVQAAEPSYSRLPARPAVAALIGTAVNGAGTKGGLGLRAAALACFEAYVADNLDARLGIISTMASPPDDNPNHRNDQDRPYSAGSVLLEGLTQNPATDAAAHGSDAYKYLISAMLLAHVVRGSETVKKVARQIAITAEGHMVKRLLKEGDGGGDNDDDDDDEDGNASLIQVIVGNLTMAERELADAVRRERSATLSSAGSTAASALSAADWTRIMTGYLVVLSVWLFDSPLSVRDLLSESATLQALIQPVAQSSGVDPLIQALAAFLLGIAYEFDTSPGNVAVTRATMHPILHSRIGAGNFAMRLERLKDDSRFTDVAPDGLEKLARLEEEREYEEFREREREEARLADAAAADAAANAPQAGGATQEGRDGAADQLAATKREEKEDEEAAARDREMELSGMGHLSRRRKMGLWFDWNFVEFWRAHSVLIQKTILIDPSSSSSQQASSSTELLDAQRQLESARDTIVKQTRKIEMLEKKIEEVGTMLDDERRAASGRIEELEGETVGLAQKLKVFEEEVARLKEKMERGGREREEMESRVKGYEEMAASTKREEGEVVEEWKRKHGDLERQFEEFKTTSTGRDVESSRTLQTKSDEIVSLASTLSSLQREHDELKNKHESQSPLLASLQTQLDVAREEIKKKQSELETIKTSQTPVVASSTKKEGEADAELATLKKEKEDLAKENEDLLVLLEELSSKRKKDKERMRDKGLEVSEDEEDDDDADDDDDDDDYA